MASLLAWQPPLPALFQLSSLFFCPCSQAADTGSAYLYLASSALENVRHQAMVCCALRVIQRALSATAFSSVGPGSFLVSAALKASPSRLSFVPHSLLRPQLFAAAAPGDAAVGPRGGYSSQVALCGHLRFTHARLRTPNQSSAHHTPPLITRDSPAPTNHDRLSFMLFILPSVPCQAQRLQLSRLDEGRSELLEALDEARSLSSSSSTTEAALETLSQLMVSEDLARVGRSGGSTRRQQRSAPAAGGAASSTNALVVRYCPGSA